MLQCVLWAVAAAAALLAWAARGGAGRVKRRGPEALPGPTPLPLLGNALLFVGTRGFLEVAAQLMQRYGQHVKFYLGSELNVVVSEPHDIRLLLMGNKLNQKGPLYKTMEDLIGPGILTGGPSWRSHRKLVTPAYSKRSVQRYSDVFRREVEQLVLKLSQRAPDHTFNIFKEVVGTTTQCVCQTLMGLSKEESVRVRRLDEVVAMTDDMYALIFAKMTKWWYWCRPLFKLLGGQRKEDQHREAAVEMSRDIIRLRREDLERRGLTAEDMASDEVYGIVDRLILSEDLSEQEVIEETFSLFTTSQEASAKIASCVLLFLAHLPEWQAKVYTEIAEVTGGKQRPLTEEELKCVPSLELVYKEALRYQPVAACIQRTVRESVALERAPVTLPAGTPVVIPIHALHRDPRYWREPDLVRPERFLPEESRLRDPNAFIPFSVGAMDCLGRVYATALIKALVVGVVQSYELHADKRLEDLEMDIAISARLKEGYNLRVRRRQHSPLLRPPS